MAEVLGIVAGIVGVLDVGAKVSSKLNKARKTWQNAAAELSALQDDLDYFRLVLNELKNAWGSLQGVIGSDVLQTIVGYMDVAKTSLADLDCIIDSFDNLTETKRRKRLEALEAAIRSALQPPTGFVIDDESQPDPAPSINDTQTTVTTPGNAPREATDWSVKYRNPDRLCKDSCTCGCHTVPVQHSLWSTPKILSGLTGVLRGSTTWVPRWTPPCNVDTCLRQTKSEYRLQFELPRWIAIYSLDALVQRRLGQPSTFGLKFRPRVNDSWLFTRFIIHDISRINDLVTKTPDCIHFRDSNGTFPLMMIATDWKSGDLAATCNALVKAGADLYAENDAGINAAAVIATQYLLRTWKPEVSKEVFRELPMPRIIDELNLSPVSQILLGQSIRDFYTTLVTLPPWHSDLTEPDATGYTPIHWAALTGNAEAVRQLASHGVNVNTKGLIGQTPLVMLCDLLDKGHCRVDKSKGVDTIEALLEAGADTEVTNKHGQGPLELACRNSQPHPESITQRMMETLIKHGAKTDITDARGNTLFHMAISSQNGTKIDDIGRVRLLVEHGLSPNTQNSLGEAPIMRAIKNGNANICEHLIKNGADLGLVTASGQTIFHCAARCWKIATLKVLVDALPPVIGVEVDAIDGKGKTAEEVYFGAWFMGGKWSPLMESRTRDCFKQLIKTRRYFECLEIDLAGWWEQWEQEQEQEAES